MPHKTIDSGLFCARHKVCTNIVFPSLVLGVCASSFSDEPSSDSECAYSKSEVARIQQRAIDGEPQSQYQIAEIRSEGDCHKFSEFEAQKWYKKSAIQGNAAAQFQLAVLYQLGIGVSQSNPTAKKWYEMSALQGHVQANRRLCELTSECASKPHSQAAIDAPTYSDPDCDDCAEYVGITGGFASP